MLFNCLECGKWFSTINITNKKLRKAYEYFIVAGMKCPFCGANEVKQYSKCSSRTPISEFPLISTCNDCSFRFKCLISLEVDDVTEELPTYSIQVTRNREILDKIKSLGEYLYINYGISISAPKSPNKYYIRIRNTVWKLSREEIDEILYNTPNSNKIIAIKNTLKNDGWKALVKYYKLLLAYVKTKRAISP